MIGLALAETYQASPINSATFVIVTIGEGAPSPIHRVFFSNRFEPFAKPAILPVSARSFVANSAAWCRETEGEGETTPSKLERLTAWFEEALKQEGVVSTTPRTTRGSRPENIPRLQARKTLQRLPPIQSAKPHRGWLIASLVEMVSREGGQA